MYTNIVNVPDSILFLTAARSAIKSITMESDALDHDEKMDLSYFVMNEATDYQIMNIVVNEEYDFDTKYSLEGELQLFDEFKEMVVENMDQFSEMVDSNVLKSLLYEIGPVSQEGISTAEPILRHLYESGIIYEKNKFSDTAKKVGGAIKNIPGAIRDKVSNVKFDREFKKRQKQAQKARPGYESPGQKMKGAFKSGMKSTKDAFKSGAEKARVKKNELLYKAKKHGVGKKAGIVALVAAATFAGYKLYQRFMSQAAKACAGKSGGEKSACMNQYKANATKAQITAMQKGVSSCAQSKNPEKCKAAIARKVDKLKSRLSKLS